MGRPVSRAYWRSMLHTSTAMFACVVLANASRVNAQATLPPASAKAPPKAGGNKLSAAAATQLSPAQLSLDEWIIKRFRNAALLPDSASHSTATVASSLAARGSAPTVDGLRTAEHRDTVVALYFDTAQGKPAFNTASNVRFVDPAGEVTLITGRVTARRAFRAPRTANARGSNAEDWRIGWAYLVALPLKTAVAATNGMNGWSLVEAPPLNTKRANN